MLIVISPAKTLDYDTPVPCQQHTNPDFTTQAAQLVKILRQYNPSELGQLMKISDKLAGLNVARFAQWQEQANTTNARQALLAFKGDVYTGLDAYSLSEDELLYAQQHLRILSGLYGILRPLDLMQPYRLEMGTKLSNAAGNNLYDFWGDIITQRINQHMHKHGLNTLLNLASNEYFKSVKTAKLDANLVNVDFKDQKNGQYKIISFHAKKARGLMSRFVIQKRIKSVAQLKDFNLEDYRFSEQQSSANHLVFLRDERV